MRGSSLWRSKRKQQEYRKISETIDDGLYALVLRDTEADDKIQIEIDTEKVEENLARCRETVSKLCKVSNDPIRGTKEEMDIVTRLDIPTERFEEVSRILNKNWTEITDSESKKAKKTLSEIESYVKPKSKSKTKRCF